MKTRISRIEIHPVDHCTLACVGCNHASPHLPVKTYYPEDYIPHLRALGEFATWDTMAFSGGEPFLHKDLGAFLERAAGCLEHRPVLEVFTNGYWIVRDDYLERAAQVVPHLDWLVISRYPEYVNRVGEAEYDRRVDLLGERFEGRITTWLHRYAETSQDIVFFQVPFHHQPFPIQSRCCAVRFCFQLFADGRLGKCTYSRGVYHIPNATPEFVSACNRSMFYDIKRAGEGFPEWSQLDVIEACSYCGVATGFQLASKWASVPEIRKATPNRFLDIMNGLEPALPKDWDSFNQSKE